MLGVLVFEFLHFRVSVLNRLSVLIQCDEVSLSVFRVGVREGVNSEVWSGNSWEF